MNNRRTILPSQYGTVQSRCAAMTALFMTMLLLCIEHVRAFASQYHISANDAMLLASAASSLTRKLSRTYIVVPKVARTAKNEGGGTSTKLNAWSIPAMPMPIMPAIPTSRETGINTLGSWYTKVDPTTPAPQYEHEDYEASYFSSPTDDWPSKSDIEGAAALSVHPPARTRGPLRGLRYVAGRVKDILVS